MCQIPLNNVVVFTWFQLETQYRRFYLIPIRFFNLDQIYNY